VPEPHHAEAVSHLLGELEASIMRIMWDRNSATVRDVLDRLGRDGRPLAYTTVLTVMGRLVGKELLSRELVGKTHVYRAALTEEQFVRMAAATRVQALVDELGDAAIAQFVSRVKELSPAHYQALERMARGGRP
jgi:predicted transcriptional regulator